MCGRYDFHPKEFAELRIRFNLAGDIPLINPRFNIAPSQLAPVIVNGQGAQRMTLFQWGLVPSWAKDASIGNNLINARAETLKEKPSFKDLLQTRRCLVLAHGFYEWRKTGKSKVPMRFALKSGESFTFAGLWDSWRKPDGALLQSYTIVTTEPNELLRPIHDRMPAILSDKDALKWVACDGSEIAHALSLLKPYPAGDMKAYEVSTLVNDPRNDSPQCIDPAHQSQPLLI